MNELKPIELEIITEELEATHQAVSRRELLCRAALVVGAAGVVASPLLMGAPAQARPIFRRPSPDQQKQIGKQAAQQILQKYRVVNDSRATRFAEMGHRLVDALTPEERSTWDYSFRVIESKDVNAFALPGGPMFMYTGLYEKLESEDALAAVTGHEMTHVRMEHWAKAYAKQQERQLGLTALLILTKAGRGAQTLASLADSALTTGFSRKEEDEADAGGLQNMVNANYNPQGMIQLFEVLQKISGKENRLVGFLSDHPLTGDRIKHSRERIAAYGQSRQFRPLTPLR